MTGRVVVFLVVFWAMQVIAQLFFKWGSLSDSRFLWGFLGGNLFGFTSIWLLMLVYKALNPNVALGVAMGGSFLISQVVVMLVFKSQVAPLQWAGIGAIVIGMLALAGGTKSTVAAVTEESPVACDTVSRPGVIREMEGHGL